MMLTEFSDSEQTIMPVDEARASVISNKINELLPPTVVVLEPLGVELRDLASPLEAPLPDIRLAIYIYISPPRRKPFFVSSLSYVSAITFKEENDK